MAAPTLSLRQLNRATLERQHLLERSALSPLEAIERLCGLQAQVPNPPYLGLWTRLSRFEKADLTDLLESRQVVRAASLRSTLHLHSAADYLHFYRTFQPALEKGLRSFFGRQLEGLDLERIVEVAREALERSPHPFSGLYALFGALEPGRDPQALAYAVRTFLPLVQVFPGGRWGSGGSPAYALTSSVLGAEPDPLERLPELIRRYLGAFGPSSVQDVQAWLGRTGLKPQLEAMRPELHTYRDAAGRELFDLGGATLPDPETPAPLRFVPEYDNLVLAHQDRRRVLADEHRNRVFLSAARVRATFLLDGTVRGVWKLEKVRKGVTLVLEPFAALSSAEQAALSLEGEKLVHFAAPEASGLALRFEAPGG